MDVHWGLVPWNYCWRSCKSWMLLVVVSTTLSLADAKSKYRDITDADARSIAYQPVVEEEPPVLVPNRFSSSIEELSFTMPYVSSGSAIKAIKDNEVYEEAKKSFDTSAMHEPIKHEFKHESQHFEITKVLRDAEAVGDAVNMNSVSWAVPLLIGGHINIRPGVWLKDYEQELMLAKNIIAPYEGSLASKVNQKYFKRLVSPHLMYTHYYIRMMKPTDIPYVLNLLTLVMPDIYSRNKCFILMKTSEADLLAELNGKSRKRLSRWRRKFFDAVSWNQWRIIFDNSFVQLLWNFWMCQLARKMIYFNPSVLSVESFRMWNQLQRFAPWEIFHREISIGFHENIAPYLNFGGNMTLAPLSELTPSELEDIRISTMAQVMHVNALLEGMHTVSKEFRLFYLHSVWHIGSTTEASIKFLVAMGSPIPPSSSKMSTPLVIPQFSRNNGNAASEYQELVSFDDHLKSPFCFHSDNSGLGDITVVFDQGEVLIGADNIPATLSSSAFRHKFDVTFPVALSDLMTHYPAAASLYWHRINFQKYVKENNLSNRKARRTYEIPLLPRFNPLRPTDVLRSDKWANECSGKVAAASDRLEFMIRMFEYVAHFMTTVVAAELSTYTFWPEKLVTLIKDWLSKWLTDSSTLDFPTFIFNHLLQHVSRGNFSLLRRFGFVKKGTPWIINWNDTE